VIVVVGSPIGRVSDGAIAAAGMSSRVALAAARAGAAVQVVGKTGDDETADGVVLDLVRGGVGHVALLRDGSRPTPLEAADDVDTAAETAPADPVDGLAIDAADVDLGLRYLTAFEVVVIAEPAPPDLVTVVADAARWSEARMVLVLASGSSVPDHLPVDVVVFEAPDADPDGVFADLVGSFAAALSDGVEPGEAFRASVDSDGWTEVAAD
jgi:sugar/nucleoside kinase (ribokinase family)